MIHARRITYAVVKPGGQGGYVDIVDGLALEAGQAALANWNLISPEAGYVLVERTIVDKQITE